MESSESNENKDIVADDNKESELTEGTPMEINTQNYEQMVKSPLQKIINTEMKDNEDSEKRVLNISFDYKKNTDYIYKLVKNQEIFQDFKPWMDNTLDKQVYMLQEQ